MLEYSCWATGQLDCKNSAKQQLRQSHLIRLKMPLQGCLWWRYLSPTEQQPIILSQRFNCPQEHYAKDLTILITIMCFFEVNSLPMSVFVGKETGLFPFSRWLEFHDQVVMSWNIYHACGITCW